jgi:thiol-disulfide isomerase/thioredoxin
MSTGVEIPNAISPNRIIPREEERTELRGSNVGGQEDGLEEGSEARIACRPCMPTQDEVERHNATHVPFRSWCPYCVAGKAKANPHYKRVESRGANDNVVSIDYAFIGDKTVPEQEDEVEDEVTVGPDAQLTGDHRDSKGNLKVLVSRDRRSGYVCANVVPQKGDHPYVVHRVGYDLSNIMGYKRVVLKSDQEPAIKKLKAAVRREYSLEIPEEQSAVGDSQSNGEVEIAIQVIEGQIRTLKCQLEHRLGSEMPSDHPLLPWLVRHAGATISRYQKGSDGLTGYRRLRGRDYDRVAIEFGECVWYLLNKDKNRGKISPRWATGVYLGSREESNEILIGTSDGVIKARSFRRQGRDEDRWSRDRIMDVKGVPWEPIPGVNTYDIRSRVQLPVDRPDQPVELPDREFARRRFKIF